MNPCLLQAILLSKLSVYIWLPNVKERAEKNGTTKGNRRSDYPLPSQRFVQTSGKPDNERITSSHNFG